MDPLVSNAVKEKRVTRYAFLHKKWQGESQKFTRMCLTKAPKEVQQQFYNVVNQKTAFKAVQACQKYLSHPVFNRTIPADALETIFPNYHHDCTLLTNEAFDRSADASSAIEGTVKELAELHKSLYAEIASQWKPQTMQRYCGTSDQKTHLKALATINVAKVMGANALIPPTSARGRFEKIEQLTLAAQVRFLGGLDMETELDESELTNDSDGIRKRKRKKEKVGDEDGYDTAENGEMPRKISKDELSANMNRSQSKQKSKKKKKSKSAKRRTSMTARKNHKGRKVRELPDYVRVCMPSTSLRTDKELRGEIESKRDAEYLKERKKTRKTARPKQHGHFGFYCEMPWFRQQLTGSIPPSRPVPIPPQAGNSRFDPFNQKKAAECVYAPIPIPVVPPDVEKLPDWEYNIPENFKEVYKAYKDQMESVHSRYRLRYEFHWEEYLTSKIMATENPFRDFQFERTPILKEE